MRPNCELPIEADGARSQLWQGRKGVLHRRALELTGSVGGFLHFSVSVQLWSRDLCVSVDVVRNSCRTRL
jgi:hypothetical protein